MRTLVFLLPVIVLFCGCEQKPTATTDDNLFKNGIRWTGDNETANYLAMAGIRHYTNIELASAYTLWDHAVKVDSTLFAPHTMLALMSRGGKSDYHKAMAKKFVSNDNETSKVFVSLLDIPRDSTGVEARRAAWAKMHELSNGPFIHYMFVRSRNLRADTAAVLAEWDKLISFAEENNLNHTAAASLNIKGYLLQLTGDLAGGTQAIEKSMKLYPDGYNPIDSRAEFYLFAGDTTNAIAWYKKVLERYPYANGAQTKLRDLEKPKK